MPCRGVVTHRARRLLASAVLAQCIVTVPAQAQWLVASPDGDTLRLGYLAQMRAEWVRRAGGDSSSQDLFLRHLRLLVSGRVGPSMSFFLGTDSPNFGKAQPDGSKNNGPIGVYDAWITYRRRTAFGVDMGLIGTPNSHNSIQSISGMLASDFGPYAFVSTPPTDARAGRDYGAQARGCVLGQHLEYRAGVFQGARGPQGDREFRYLARLVVDAFRAEQSVYYSGTSFGTRRSLALGVSADHQERYDGVGADLYVDQPLMNGDGVTLQVDVVRYDGGVTFPSFPRQRTELVEAGYFRKSLRVAPFLQLARLDFGPDSLADSHQWLAGLAYVISGHRLNLRAVYGRSRRGRVPASGIFQLTFQSLEF